MPDKTTYFYPHKTIRLGSYLMDLSTPKVMGILNVTPDSFYDGGRYSDIDKALLHVEKMLSEGADIIDVGGMSSRPGAVMISDEEDLERTIPFIEAIMKRFDAPVSVDTVYAKVAQAAIHHGAVMINDISAGSIDTDIHAVCASAKVPYVLMHMQGLPETMQKNPTYKHVTEEVFSFFLEHCMKLTEKGIADIILDPGFGFGKSLTQNYDIASQLEVFHKIGFPLLVGVSRKSMICKLLQVSPAEALNGTTALHVALLCKGASILRVHDVREAKQAIAVASHFFNN
jgi:dihydropteroate synthase